MAISGQWEGTLYQWYPNHFPGKLHYYPDLEVVARSFSEFLEMLRPHDYEDEEIEQIFQRLGAIELTCDSIYTPKMVSLNARYVYSTLGEEARRLSEQDLRGLEEALGYNLPHDYREFVRDFGGYSFLCQGCAVEEFPEFRYEVRLNGYLYPDGYWVRFFHGLISDDYHSFWGHIERLREVLPEGLIPIADGGRLCLELSGDNAGTVYLAPKAISEHTFDETATRVERSSLTPLASSFDEFINALVLS